MATAKSAKQKSPQKSRGIFWKNENVKLLLEVMKEETILFSLDNAKTPKEKRAAYEYGCDASFLVFRFLSVHIRSELNSGEHSSSCHQQNCLLDTYCMVYFCDPLLY